MTTMPTTPVTTEHGAPLTLPDTFIAFHTLRRGPYLRYASQRLPNHAAADQAVRETFGDLAITWPQVLCGANPAAYAWEILNDRILQHTRPAVRWWRRTTRGPRPYPTQPHPATHRLPTADDDIYVLGVMGYTSDQIADLTGLPSDTVRALLTPRPTAAVPQQRPPTAAPSR